MVYKPLEPDQYLGKFNISLTGAQIAAGYKELRGILNGNSLYGNSILIGPSPAGAGSVKLMEE